MSEVAGVALLIGAAVVTVLAVCFTEVLDDVLEGDGIAGIDQPAAEWLAAHRDLWLTMTLQVVTAAGGPVGMAALTVLTCAAVVFRCRSWLPVVLALVGGGGIALVVLVAKALVVRDRPALPFATIAEGGYSFPSGHAAGTAAVTLLSGWLVARWLIMSWTGRVIVWTLAMGWSALVGFSRIYLGVHYISDVLAGWLVGMVWGGVVVLVGTWWDSTRGANAAKPASDNQAR
ncbi:PAP2 superfamily protein [Mycobacterium kansasii 824]|uniref:PAP2 superfamily protein n=1 Tax=Mycobacterium kansasii TaxID=1768 RepID=A0A1V3XEH0_MYCKA|nr:PAP2 superfamily protein [Mycobacterium kansasii 824]OOK77623.1 PAP2 superfamily protein [Mycobacterium kansasii]